MTFLLEAGDKAYTVKIWLLLVTTIPSLRSGSKNIYNEFSDIDWIHEDYRDKCDVIFFLAKDETLISIQKNKK